MSRGVLMGCLLAGWPVATATTTASLSPSLGNDFLLQSSCRRCYCRRGCRRRRHGHDHFHLICFLLVCFHYVCLGCCSNDNIMCRVVITILVVGRCHGRRMQLGLDIFLSPMRRRRARKQSCEQMSHGGMGQVEFDQ